MKRDSWIAVLLNLITFTLETLLSSSKKPNRFQGGHADQDDVTTDEGKNDVQAAFDFFGINDNEDTAALRDAVKKKFRKLSLVHHPDRNENSEESVEMMQRVNYHYDVLCEELDRREGIVHEDDEQEGDEKENHQEESTREEEKQGSYAHKSKRKKNRRNNKRRQSAKKTSRAARHRQRRHEQHANKAMEEEMREIRRQKQQVNATKRKMKREVHKTIHKHHLDTTEGRKKANQEFVKAMNQFQGAPKMASGEMATSSENVQTEVSMHDIDGDDLSIDPQALPNEESINPTGETKEKPRNLVMDCCMDDIAVALRMELADVAIATIQDRLGDRVVSKLKLSMLAEHRMPNDSDIASAHEAAIYEVFQSPLDDDGNTILHHAVYYESLDVIGLVYFVACQADALPEIFLQENRFGDIPLDFCKCCVKGVTVPQKMQSLTDAARAMQPSLKKTAERLLNIVRQVDWVSVLNAAASIGVGMGLFDTWFTTALVISTAHLGASEGFPPHKRVGGLYSWHASWRVCKLLFSIPSLWILCCFVLPSLSLFACCAGFELACLYIGALPRALISCMCANSAWIPVPAWVKRLRLGDLQFYLLFTIAILALHNFETWIFRDAELNGSSQNIDVSDAFHEFEAEETEVKQSYQSIEMNDAIDKFAAFEAEGEEF